MRQSQPIKTSQITTIHPICTHIKKLTKIQIISIYQNPCQFTCPYHFSNFTNLTICLNCNKSFCGIHSIQKCILTHQTMNDNQHIFSINLQSSEVYCNLCKQSINIMINCHNNTQIKENDDFKKLKRFMEFIIQAHIKVKKIYEESLKSINISNNYSHYKGLQNLGNTCFLNCVLQVLNFSKHFTQLYSEYKISGGFSKSILSTKKSLNKQIEYFYDQVIQQNQGKIWHIVTNKKQKKNEQNQKFIKSITNCKLNQLVINFFNQMKINQYNSQDQQEKTHSAIQILEYIENIDKKYTYKQEQDAEQALLFIIDILVQGQFIAMGYDQQRYRKVQQFIGRQKITPLQRIFGTYLVSQIFCENCKKISYTFDLTYHLSIDLNTQKHSQFKSIKQHFASSQLLNRQKLYYKNLDYPLINQQQPSIISLPQFFHSFFSTQRLTLKQNFYSCSSCKSLVGYKRFYLVSSPQILIISIKRFSHKMIKNNKYVEFNEKICLKDVCMREENQNQENQKCQYQLYGVIVHIGETINSGHYVCYARANANVWIRCSDTNIRKVKFNQVKQQQAYILCYQKIK